jgi:mRNA turnover protein 4
MELIIVDRFFFGKNKVMALALGRTPQEEQKPNLHKVAEVSDNTQNLLFPFMSPLTNSSILYV